MTTAYLDSSAIIKLLVPEAESATLRRAAAGWLIRTTAALALVEVPRALRRSGHEAAVEPARRLMAGMRILAVDEEVLRRAADLGPPTVRSLDAIHLAAALTFGEELDALVTYDRRMADAAGGLGLRVEAPA